MDIDSKVVKNKILIIPTVHNVNECAVINALHDKLEEAESENSELKAEWIKALRKLKNSVEYNAKLAIGIEVAQEKEERAEQQLRDIDALDGYLTLTHFNPRKRVINYCDVRAIINRSNDDGD